MLTIREQAQSLLNNIYEGQDELSLINQLMTVSKDVVKEMVTIIKEENRSQYERDKATLEFYEKSCEKILEIIDNHDLSEAKTKVLTDLFKELMQQRQIEKNNQDNKSEERKNESSIILGTVLGVIVLGLLSGIMLNKKIYGKNNNQQVS